jgi:hypothetical protein
VSENVSENDALARAEELLERLQKARAEVERLSAAGEVDATIEVLRELSEIAKAVEAELERARRDAGAER